MKKYVIIIVLITVTMSVFAQFGGGTGTEEDPYLLYSKGHFEELQNSLSITVDYTDTHFSLMNDITDSLRSPIGKLHLDFNGYFHGHGHTIRVALNYRNDTYYYTSLFMILSPEAYVDSITVEGYIYAMGGIVKQNKGTVNSLINKTENNYQNLDFLETTQAAGGICQTSTTGAVVTNCINYSTIHGYYLGGICSASAGSIINCRNYGIIKIYNTQGINNLNFGGICYNNDGNISGCKNFGSFEFTGQDLISGGGGICGHENGLINNCQNYANLSGKVDNLGGIAGSVVGSIITNCSNYGVVDGWQNIGGIVGNNYSWGSSIINCFNSGSINGLENIAGIFGNRYDDTITNCLNIGLCNGSAITCLDTSGLIANNYYDKQMCLSKGIDSTDILGLAEGKLTTQLTGTSSELQAMLGNGWSYAEGRYPIPLGLENDSMTLVAATPIYLHFETEEDYNHIDSVSWNFIVGLENNVTWNATNGRVSLNDEDVTLLSIGMETLTVNLGDYSKRVRINIVDTEVSSQTQTYEKYISVFPNPTNENLIINLNGNNADQLVIIDI
ncbi:MAG: hypothetical protein PHW82_14510, partial [Bacteroidales bacterium]|nr:hypothetical protein [Bacteroidales bacterium]